MGNVLIGAELGRALTADDIAQSRGFGLLDRYTAGNGNEYVFLQAGSGGVTGAGYVVTYTPAGVATMTATAQALTAFGAPVAVAQVDMAEGEYGWFLIKGFGDVRVSASCAANAVVAATSTAGQLDDAVGKTIHGLILTTAREASAGLAPGALNYPTVGVTTT